VRFAVLGAGGQLGRDLCPRLEGEVVALPRARVDLTRPGETRAVLTSLGPDVVVNCAAYNFVDSAEAEVEAAFAVNAFAVRELALVCRDLGCVLVHFSTDHVFGLDAGRRTPWTEDSAPGPVSVYGASKLAGEHFVRALCPRHFVVRTCGLFGLFGSGGKGGNFVETMLRLAAQSRPLRVVADQVCTPSYTADVADAAARLVRTDRYGLYHVTSGGACTWHEFAREIFALAGLQVEVQAITSDEYGAAARRPAYSVLDNGGWRRLGLPPLPPWQVALAAYLKERERTAMRADAS
jgi:dTDP-4-dehydrorhamnose reductase